MYASYHCMPLKIHRPFDNYKYQNTKAIQANVEVIVVVV